LALPAVNLGSENLILANSSTATLNGAVSGTGGLTASGTGSFTVDNSITAGSVSDSEGTTLNGTGGSETITTTGGDQDYTGMVTLGAATTLNSGTVELATVTGGGNSLTLNNTGLATLNGPVSGVNVLTADRTGGTLLANSTIAAADVSDSETTTLSGGSVTTTGGDQDYTGTVTLGAATTLNSGTVELATVTGGGNSLTLNNTGVATLNGVVNGVHAFSISGASRLNGGTVATTAGQSYGGEVILGAATTLRGTTVTLPEVGGGGYNLTLNNRGTATFNGPVSGVDVLLVTGPSQLNGGRVTTEAGQTFGAITLGAPTRLVGNPVRFSSVNYNGYTLSLGDVDLAVTETATGDIFGALQRRERKPKATNPTMDSAPSLPYPSLVPPASSYPALVRGAKG
jgi:hypothetical protein